LLKTIKIINETEVLLKDCELSKWRSVKNGWNADFIQLDILTEIIFTAIREFYGTSNITEYFQAVFDWINHVSLISRSN
jgi:hypothetical protein